MQGQVYPLRVVHCRMLVSLSTALKVFFLDIGDPHPLLSVIASFLQAFERSSFVRLHFRTLQKTQSFKSRAAFFVNRICLVLFAIFIPGFARRFFRPYPPLHVRVCNAHHRIVSMFAYIRIHIHLLSHSFSSAVTKLSSKTW